ncbi:MAG TPA: SCO family protein [Candidatus Baltobacteraceae bacterium]
MRLRSARGVSLLGLILLLALAAPASAHPRLQGVVLATDAQAGRVIVRHEPFGPMPAMTMSFAVAPRDELRQLHAGQMIDAELDSAAQPWTLRELRVTGTQSITSVPKQDPQSYSEIRTVTPVAIGDTVPNVTLIDQQGKPFGFASLRGSDVVLAFIYTRCQDGRECPLISAKFHRLQQLMAGTKTHLVEVSLDPSFDTPPVLARYAQNFGADPSRWTLLTGDLRQALDFAAKFDVSAIADPHYGIIHSERTVIIDRAGVIRQLIDEAEWSPDEIVQTVRANDQLSSNPIQRLNLWLSSQVAAICGDGPSRFSAISDLVVAIIIFSGFGWIIYRVGRGIFAASP